MTLGPLPDAARHGRRRQRRHLRRPGRRRGRAHRRASTAPASTGSTTSASPGCTGCSASATGSADADCLIVVAGMEGALPSVVGGLTGVPIVAVPTSVGYGASLGGLAALLAMLNSCAPGVTVVNIDNGYGAGVFAARVARQTRAPMTRALGRRLRGRQRRHAARRAGRRRRARSRCCRTRSTRSRPSRSRSASRRYAAAGWPPPACHVEVAESAPPPHLARRPRACSAGTRPRRWPVFERLAVAEAAVHGTDPGRGALPRGRRARRDRRRRRRLRRLRPPRRRRRSRSRPSRSAPGTVQAAHGTLPVPPPAVAELLRGVPSYAGPVADGDRARRPAPRC